MTPSLSFVDTILTVHGALDDDAIEHAFYAEPRATIDIDVNAFLPTDERDRVVRALRVLQPAPADRADAERDRWEQFMLGRVPLDVFYSYDSFHDAMRARLRCHRSLAKISRSCAPSTWPRAR